MFCPSCRQEFESFARACPDCEVALVAELASAAPGAAAAPPVAVIEGADVDAAERMLERLLALGVPARPGEEHEHALAVLVPAPLVRGAIEVLEMDPGLVRDVEQESGESARFRVFDPARDHADEAPDTSLLEVPLRELATRGAQVVVPLLDIVRRGDEVARRKAVLAVRAMGAAGLAALLQMLARLASELRADAVYAVVRELRKDDLPQPALADLVAVASDAAAAPPVRGLALHALGRLRSESVARRLVELLRDADPAVREHADEALCALLDEDVGFDPAAAAPDQQEAIASWQRLLAARGL